MNLNEYKINGYEHNIKDLPDQITGRAAWLKEFFDGRGDGEIKASINGIIDALSGELGAEKIGACAPTGVSYSPENEKTVQAVLNGLREYINQKLASGEGGTGGGAGDMLCSVYDTGELKLDIYAYALEAAKREAQAAALKYAGEYNYADAEFYMGDVEITSRMARAGTTYTVEFEAPQAFSGAHQFYIDGAQVAILKPSTTAPANGAWAKGAWVILKRVGRNAYFQG